MGTINVWNLIAIVMLHFYMITKPLGYFNSTKGELQLSTNISLD